MDKNTDHGKSQLTEFKNMKVTDTEASTASTENTESKEDEDSTTDTSA